MLSIHSHLISGSQRRFFNRPARKLRRASVRTHLARPLLIESLEDRTLLAMFTPLSSVVDGEQLSLREAISSANSNGEDDTIILAAGTYSISLPGRSDDLNATGDFDLTEAGHSVSIIGADAATTIIDAQQLDRVLEVFPGVTVNLSRVTIKNGQTQTEPLVNDHGGGIFNHGSLTITNTIVSNNSTVRGAGIYNDLGTLVLVSSTVSENTAFQGGAGGGPYGGGGIWNYGGRATITDSTISGNTAAAVDGVAAGIANEGGTVTLTDSVVSGNVADGFRAHAGAIFSGDGCVKFEGSCVLPGITLEGSFEIVRSTIQGNSAQDGPGAIENYNAVLRITSTTISDNSFVHGGAGGGIFSRGAGSQLVVVDSSILRNIADGVGGGISLTHGIATISGSTISSNWARWDGGGVTNTDGGTLTVSTSMISDNRTNEIGGGGGLYNTSSASITDSTISGNTNGEGGGISNRGSMTLANSTISANTTGPFGRGAGIHNAGTMSSTNVTVFGNVAWTFGTGGGINSQGTTTLVNTIVAGNSVREGLYPDVAGTFASQGHNLIGDATGSTGFGASGDRVGSGASPIDPRLGPLQDNGGPTFTHALLTGSPAIDAGDNAVSPDRTGPYDQRGTGFPRVIDGDGGGTAEIDIGAFESPFFCVESPSLVVTTTADVVANDCETSLREAINFANGNSTDDVIYLAPGVYELSIAGAGEDGNALGDLDVTEPGHSLEIIGDGAAITTIDGNQNDRVLDVHGTTLTISGITVTGGFLSGTQQGAGIRSNGGTLTVTDAIVTQNSSSRSAGIYTIGGALSVSASTISNNSSGRNGGGIFVEFTSAQIRDTTFSDNSASDNGGGIYSWGSTLSVSNSVFLRNHASLTSGGGIHATFGSTTEVKASTFESNTADNGGGGIFNEGGSRLKLVDSIFTGNNSQEFGGGLYNAGTMTVINTTISGNAVGYQSGGGVATEGSLVLINSTVTGNSAGTVGGATGGGIFVRGAGSASVQNTIVAGNHATDPDVSGSFVSLGHNLIGDSGAATGFTHGVSGDIVGNSASPIDPLLGPLQDNGGSTFTQALGAGSPAIDAGDNAVFPGTTGPYDQRGAGFPRVIDGDGNGAAQIDIGAFESPFVCVESPSLVVTTTADVVANDCATSLREAINFANSNNADDIIELSASTYDLSIFGTDEDGNATGDLDVTESGHSLTIQGTGAAITVIDAHQIDRVLHVLRGVTVRLSGLAVLGGRVNRSGGGIANDGVLEITNCTVSDNEGGDGGGIASGGTLAITNSTLARNRANHGGGVITGGRVTVTISGSTIFENFAVHNGGAVSNEGSTVEITNSVLTDNSAGALGGGVANFFGGTVTVADSTISANSGGQGGGIFSAGSPATISDSIISGNSAELNGGGVYVDGANVTITDVLISNNWARWDGGGLVNTGSATMVLARSTISANRTNEIGRGGGIHNAATLRVVESTLSGNTNSSGGGIHNAGSAEVINSTISANTTGTSGRGAGVFNAGIMTLVNTTISRNEAWTFGNAGGIYSQTDTILLNTIVAGNSSRGFYPDVAGSFTSQGHNLIGDDSGSAGFGTNVDLIGTSSRPIDPLIGPLQDNGGPTFTHALLLGSPALDAGDDVVYPGTTGPYDQRGPGFPRMIDGDGDSTPHIDIGAYESETLVPPNRPPTARAGGPYTVAEGDSIVLDASASSDPDQNPATLSYEWDLDGDTAFGETGPAATNGDELGIHPSFLAAGLDGPDSVTVVLRVTDSGALTSSETAIIEINNVPPSILALTNEGPIPEGSSATLTGTIVDPGTSDTFTLVINWGDPLSPNNVESYSLPASSTGIQTFAFTHQYLDDNPTLTVQDTYTITAAVTDDDSDTDSDTETVLVRNAAPVVGPIVGPASVSMGVPATFSAAFFDLGTLDTHTCAVSWGDSTSSPGTVSESGGSGVCTATHTYSSGGSFSVTFAVTDDDTGSDSESLVMGSVARSAFILNPTLCGALTATGNAQTDFEGPITVASNCAANAISASGNAHISASRVDVVGAPGWKTTGNAIITSTPTNVSGPVADPLGSVPAPTGGTQLGQVNCSGNSVQTIEPGVYSRIQASGNCKLTMNPGTYVIAGGGYHASGNASVNGSEVTIYNTWSNFPNAGGSVASVQISGNGAISLTPPRSGPLAGIIIFQARDNTKPLSLSGNASGMAGTIYARAAQLNLTGNGSLEASLVVDNLRLSGNAAASLTSGSGPDDSDAAILAAGQLRTGTLWVSIQSDQTTMTPDQLARIRDAIATINDSFGGYGVALVEIDADSIALADIRLHVSSSSPCGDVAAGVLGCSTIFGDITFLEGWNWYAGADPATAGGSQYDFQTIATHELGHSIGVGHSPGANSVMYASLTAGVSRRSFAAGDLAQLAEPHNVEHDAHGLAAALYASGHAPHVTIGHSRDDADPLQPVDRRDHLLHDIAACPSCAGARLASIATDHFLSSLTSRSEMSALWHPLLLGGRSDGSDWQQQDVADLVDGHADGGHEITGRGRDVLIGGEGTDVLVGRSGHDRLIGGYGADPIFGIADHTVKSAEGTIHDSASVLTAIPQEWTQDNRGLLDLND